MCGLTNWEMAGRKAPPKGVKANVGRSLWTPHTFKNLNNARVRLISSGPAASHSVVVTEDNRCLVFGKNDKGKLSEGMNMCVCVITVKDCATYKSVHLTISTGLFNVLLRNKVFL